MSKRTYESTMVKLFALIGHRSAGKTTLGDALLCAAGVTRTTGSVDSGTSLLDHEPEERKNHLSLGPSTVWMEWQQHLLYMFDTPGSELVAHEKALPIAGSDGLVVVVSAPDSIEVGTERALELAIKAQKPRLIVVSKMDRGHSIDEIHTRLLGIENAGAVCIQVPYYDSEGQFEGYVCLLKKKLYRTVSGEEQETEIPAEMEGAVSSAWEALVENVALANDDLLEDYLEFFDLSTEQVERGLAAAVQRGVISPIVYATSKRALGVKAVLSTICLLFPDPTTARLIGARDEHQAPFDLRATEEFVAQVIYSRLDEDNERYHVIRVWSGSPDRHGRWTNGTRGGPIRVRRLYQLRGPRRCSAFHVGPGAVFATWDDLNARPGDCITEGARLDLVRPAPPPPMMSLTLRPKSSHDRERLAKAVTQLLSMDTSLLATTDDITGALILSGIGEGHLRRAIRRLESLSGAPVEAHLPAVGYRESPRQSVLDVEGIHRRMSDGCVAEFGSCRLSIVPDHDSLGNSYIDRSTDEEVPKRFRGSIDEGVQSGMRHGPTAGYPVIGAAVSLSGGDYNMLQSTEDHVRLAGTNAVKNALEQSGTFLLEPWCRVDILTPCELGNVLSDISSNRGRVLGLEVEGKNTHVQASYPYRELRTFASRLNSLTYGRGKFTYGVSHYERLPSDQVAEVIKCSPFRPKALNSFQTARGAK